MAAKIPFSHISNKLIAEYALSRREALMQLRYGIALAAASGVELGNANEVQAAMVGSMRLRPSKLRFKPEEPIDGSVVFSNHGTRRVVVDGIMRISMNGILVNAYRYHGQIALGSRETGVVKIAQFVDTRGLSPAAPPLAETQGVNDTHIVPFRASVEDGASQFNGDDIPMVVGRRI